MKFTHALLRRPVLASTGAVATALAGITGVLPMPAALGFSALFSGLGLALSLGSRRADKMRAAEQARAVFLSTLGHEVRTPLNGILGMTKLILDTGLTPEQRTYALAVHESGETLSVLLEDLLALADSAGGARLEINAGPADVITLVEGIGEIMAPRAWSKGLELATAIAPGVSASAEVDAQRVRQILMSLASNGLHRTEHGGVTLTLAQKSAADQDGDVLVFEVSDTGPEFPADILGRRLANLAGTADRMELGLAACQRIARAMGGSVRLDNTDGGGQVQLRLPVPSRKDLRKPRREWPHCLIVSPSPIVRQALEIQLDALERTAVSAETAQEAAAHAGRMQAAGTPLGHVFIDAAGAAPASLAASLEQIRGDREPPLSCILMLTPTERGNLTWIPDAGFAGYLMKPVRLRALRRRLEGNGSSGAAAQEAPDKLSGDTLAALAAPVEPMRILLAEDNDINAVLATALLTRCGHQIIRAIDGSEAVGKALEGDFDLILMDLNMPVLNGLEAANKIVSALGTGAPPIIAFSANSHDMDIRRCADAGMSGHLTKPIDLETFQAMLVKTAKRTKKSQAA